MNEEQEKAVRMLREGLAFFDEYEPVPSDDCAVLADANNCMHEFTGDKGRLQVGHLRAIASLFTQEN